MPRDIMNMLRVSVRTYMRDFPELNRLLDHEEENSKEQQEFAIQMALDWINSIPPLSQYSLNRFPYLNWLIRAASLTLAESLLFQLERNDTTTQDPGGVMVSENQLKFLTQRIDRTKALLAQEIRNGKAAAQLNAALGASCGVESPFGISGNTEDL